MVNAPPVFSVDIASGQNKTPQKKEKKKKKDRKENKEKKKYIVHNVNKCMLIYLGGKVYMKGPCPKALSRATLLLTGHGEIVILWSTG